MLPFLGSPWWAEPGGSASRRVCTHGEPWFLMALGQRCPEEHSLPIKLGSERSTLRATSPHLGPQISGQETYSSCGEALILDNSNSDWTGALEALCIIKEEVPLDKPGPFLPETPQGGQQRPPDLLAFPGPGQSSVPLKDKRRHGFALW